MTARMARGDYRTRGRQRKPRRHRGTGADRRKLEIKSPKSRTRGSAWPLWQVLLSLVRTGQRCSFRGLGVGRLDFPVTVFFEAGTDCAQLSAFFDDEGGAALGAGLSQRLVRSGEVALRVTVAAVEDAAAALARHTLHEFPRAAFRAVDAERLRADEFALWVAGAADELAVAAFGVHALV